MAGRGRPKKNTTTDKPKTTETKVVEEKVEVEDKKPEEIKAEKPKVEEKAVEEKPVEKPKPEPEKKKKVSLNDFDRNQMVQVVSFVDGLLIYKSEKTGMTYRFSQLGAEDEMEFSEILAMRSSKPKFLERPWLIIMDDEIADYFKLSDLYDKIAVKRPDEIKALFKDPEKLEKLLKNPPKGFVDVLASQAAKMIESGELESLKVKNLIEEKLNIELD